MSIHQPTPSPAEAVDEGGEVRIWPIDRLAECVFCAKRWPTDVVDAHEQVCVKNKNRLFRGP